MRSIFEQEVQKLQNKPHVNQKVLHNFLKRISLNKPFFKSQNAGDHFGSFLLPIHKETRQTYFGHHIKANIWLPPGGHIEENESPEVAMRREFREELGHTLTNEKIELFNLSMTYYQNHWHYDFWYLVYTDLIDFTIDTREFYKGEWISVDEILNRMNVKEYTPVIIQLQNYLAVLT